MRWILALIGIILLIAAGCESQGKAGEMMMPPEGSPTPSPGMPEEPMNQPAQAACCTELNVQGDCFMYLPYDGSFACDGQVIPGDCDYVDSHDAKRNCDDEEERGGYCLVEWNTCNWDCIRAEEELCDEFGEYYGDDLEECYHDLDDSTEGCFGCCVKKDLEECTYEYAMTDRGQADCDAWKSGSVIDTSDIFCRKAAAEKEEWETGCLGGCSEGHLVEIPAPCMTDPEERFALAQSECVSRYGEGSEYNIVDYKQSYVISCDYLKSMPCGDFCSDARGGVTVCCEDPT